MPKKNVSGASPLQWQMYIVQRQRDEAEKEFQTYTMNLPKKALKHAAKSRLIGLGSAAMKGLGAVPGVLFGLGHAGKCLWKAFKSCQRSGEQLHSTNDASFWAMEGGMCLIAAGGSILIALAATGAGLATIPLDIISPEFNIKYLYAEDVANWPQYIQDLVPNN